MKKATILILLGIIGLAQYVYFQFSSLAYVVDEVVRENIGGVPVVTDIIYHRDWTLGLIGAVAGIAFLAWGIYKMRSMHERQRA